MADFDKFIKGFEDKPIKDRYIANKLDENFNVTDEAKYFTDKDEAMAFVKDAYSKGEDWSLGDGYNDDGSEKPELEILFDAMTQRGKDEEEKSYQESLENDMPFEVESFLRG